MRNTNIPRREFLRTAAIGAATTFMSPKQSIAKSQRTNHAHQKNIAEKNLENKKPNVLFIMTDQHRADFMTCAGNKTVPTPNLDRIAAAGVRFEHAYCPYPVCVASRMSLLTGLYTHNHGAITNKNRLDWRYRTIAHHFAECGYHTALVGKMHFLDTHNHGFQYYMSINDWLMSLGPKVRDYANEIANHQFIPRFFNTVHDTGAGLPDVHGLWEKPGPWAGNVDEWDPEKVASDLPPEDHLDMFVARQAKEFIRRYKDHPFFLVASFMKPHTPFHPPKKWAEMFPVSDIKLKPVGDIGQYPPHTRARIKRFQSLGEERLKSASAGYLGNLAFVDFCIGHLYNALEEQGLLENTIVVYTSDHGEMAGDLGLYQKFCLYEPAVAVPLVISYPGRIPSDKTNDALTEYIGLYPTIAELAGLPKPESTYILDMPDAPEKLDAKSFADIALNPDQQGPDAAFSEFNLNGPVCQYMVRTRRYKYIYNQGTLHELYDHHADPGETTNLIHKPNLKDVRKDLKDRLFDWYNPEKNPHRA